MRSYYWIKLYHEILDDPKMGRLDDHLWRRCIELFLLAGETGRDGMLPPLADMAWKFRADDDGLVADLQALAKAGIVEETPNGWLVVNFAERQAAESSTERSRRHRERSRDKDETEDEQSGDDTATKCPTDKIREEKSRQDQDTPKGADAPLLQSLDDWLGFVKEGEGKKGGMPARIGRMAQRFYAAYKPDYGRIGRAAKQCGGYSRLAHLLWMSQGYRVTGDPIDYCVAMHKGKASKEPRGQGESISDKWLRQSQEAGLA